MNTRKFKKGDKVRYVEEGKPYLTKNKIYKVILVELGIIHIIDDMNNSEGYYPSRFVLANKINHLPEWL